MHLTDRVADASIRRRRDADPKAVTSGASRAVITRAGLALVGNTIIHIVCNALGTRWCIVGHTERLTIAGAAACRRAGTKTRASSRSATEITIRAVIIRPAHIAAPAAAPGGLTITRTVFVGCTMSGARHRVRELAD